MSISRFNETKKIVKGHGSSVEDYAMIATQMNKDPKLRVKAQTLINEVKLSIRKRKSNNETNQIKIK